MTPSSQRLEQSPIPGRFTLRSWALSGAGSALLLLWFGLGDPELLLAGTLVLIAQVISLFIVRLLRPEIDIGRRLNPAIVHDGETTTVTLMIRNSANRSVSNLTFEDAVDRLGVATFEATRIDKGEGTTATYQVTCRPRGVYRVGPAIVRISDPLGLAEVETISGPTDRLVVYPAIEHLAGFPVVRGEDPALQVSRPEQSLQGGEDFYTLREYRTGDDLRRVHWPSSAKTDELMIRQLETPWQPRALVFLDIRSVSYQSPEAFEKAVSGAATMVTHLVESGFNADLWAGGEPVDASRYELAMEKLALLEPDTTIDIEAVASRIRRQSGGGALIIVTGRDDGNLLRAQQLLSLDYPTTVLMTVADSKSLAPTGFHRINATTVSIQPNEPWAPEWLAASRAS